MAINQAPVYPYSNQTAGIGFNYGGQQPFQSNFGTNPQMNQMGQMNVSSQPGLSIVSVTSDDQITNYPVASGNTVAFVNFNTNRLCFKSTNQNGVPMQLRWATFTYDETATNQTQQNYNQNGQTSVSREEFDELRTMMAQTMSMIQQQNDRSYKNYNKGGRRNDRPEDVSADAQ